VLPRHEPFKTAVLYACRVKNGTLATHPVTGRELRKCAAPAGKRQVAIRLHLGAGAPLSAPGFSRMIERAAVAAKLGIRAHAHMLRHACGFKLANDGVDTRSLQAYLGHRNIQNTAIYTKLSSNRFRDFWRD
jgi:site-specific recombinase XerD